MPLRPFLSHLCLILLGLFLGYSIAEIAFRIERYYQLTRTKNAYQMVKEPIIQYDPDVGFKYLPNRDFTLCLFNENHEIVRLHPVSTNNFGHISPENDQIEKPKGEFRIAVIGDSFTASLYNQDPWPWLLQEELNQKWQLKKAMGVERFKILNFGRDTAGFEMFWRINLKEVSAFQPDVVLVNFIGDDLFRKMIWKKSYPAIDPAGNFAINLVCSVPRPTLEDPNCTWDTVLTIKPEFRYDRKVLAQTLTLFHKRRTELLPFFSFKPFLLGKVFKIDPLDSQLTLARGFQLHSLDTFNESAKILRHWKRTHPRMIPIYLPSEDQIRNHTINPEVQDLLRDADLSILDMTSAFQKVPLTELDELFNLPFDGHFSNKGAHFYAHQLANIFSKPTRDALP